MLDTKRKTEEFKFYYLFFLALTFLFAMLLPFSHGDLTVWIAEGRQIFLQNTIYIKEAYSLNETISAPYPWLSSVLYYLIDINWGIDAIFFIHRLIPVLIIAFWLNKYPALLHKKNWLILVFCISGLSMLIVDRPALLALPFILISFYLVETERMYKFPMKSFFLVVLWTNLHGSFLVLLALLAYKIGIEFIQNRRIGKLKDKILFFLFCFLATLINPWGYKIYGYVLETAAISRIRMTEWQPLSLQGSSDILFETCFFAVTVLYLLFITYQQRKVKYLISSSIMFFLISSVSAVRNLPLFYMTLPLFWGQFLVQVESTSFENDHKKALPLQVVFNRSIVVIIALTGFFMFSDFSHNVRPYLPKKYSYAYDYTSCFKIANYINEHSTGKKIFNSWVLGSFLLYSQKNQIFIDTRNIIYSDGTYNEYERIMANYQNSAEALLDKYQLDYVIAGSTKGITKALQVSQNWTFIMEDNGYELFERK